MTLVPGQTLSLEVEKPAAGGRMIARVDGQVVLVSGAIPGERLAVRVERIAKHVAYADTVAVEEPSPDRRTASGDPLCGGCLYSHIAYPRQLEIKGEIIADAFARIGHLHLPSPVGVAASPEDGYRMRARLHIRGHRLGFFREGTHEVCDVRQTRQLLPQSVDALDRLMAVVRSLGVDAIREIELAENLDASHRVVALDTVSAIDARTVERLASTDGITGLVSALGVRGEAHVTDRLMLDDAVGVALRRHVLAFFQGNRHRLRDLVLHVVSQVPSGGHVIDLYAGVGLFAISAAVARDVRVTAVEGDRVAAADLAANATSSGRGVTPVHDAVENFLRDASRARGVRLPRSREAPASAEASGGFAAAFGGGESADRWSRGGSGQPDQPLTVIVDPPRTGMSREAVDRMLRLQAARIVYVSCDVATLARDSRRIVDAGYTIDRADAFDLFPNTPHVETVVVFVRT